MKLIITLFMVMAINIFNPHDFLDSNTEVISREVLFDGSEGNLHFFTDTNNEAITIEDEKGTIWRNLKRGSNDYVGRYFILTLKETNLETKLYNPASVIKLKLKESSN